MGVTFYTAISLLWPFFKDLEGGQRVCASVRQEGVRPKPVPGSTVDGRTVARENRLCRLHLSQGRKGANTIFPGGHTDGQDTAGHGTVCSTCNTVASVLSALLEVLEPTGESEVDSGLWKMGENRGWQGLEDSLHTADFC